jgi:NADH-quinone oxidoreductase subunit I
MGYGIGVLRGLGITLNRVIKTYIGDFKHLGRPLDPKTLAERQGVRGSGIITVQYPEERMVVPEEFRFIPFLVYEPKLDENGNPLIDPQTKTEVVGYERCTACGICAKVCPPQCIWIVRATTPEGKPKPQAAEFYIDIDICMNCGYCAEFCPFDAIKMDHDFELASYERHVSHIYDVKTLMKSTTYHAQIHPLDWQREQQESKAKEAAKAKKQAAG